MELRISMMLVMAAAMAFPATPARADNGGPQKRTAGMWDTKLDLTLAMSAFGYSPSQVVSDSSPRLHGGDLDEKQGEFRFRLFTHGRYMDLELLPYTNVPKSDGHGYHVSSAGIELNALIVLGDRARFGMYHHSSHNFSSDTYGRGIDLNAIVLDGELTRGEIGVTEGGRYRVRGVFHYYFTQNGSPYAVTRGTDVSARRLGHTRMRGELEIGMYDAAERRAVCNATLVASRQRIASMRNSCDLLFSPGPSMFGTLGEHLLVGPYLEYVQNLTRISDFGSNAYAGGVRIRFLFAKDDGDLMFR